MEISSAVAKNHLPGDQFSVVAGEKRDQPGQVLRFAPLLDRLVLHNAVESFLVGMGHRAFSGYHSRGDRVDRDVVVAEFFGQHAREAHHRALRRDIGHLTRIGQKVSPRSHVDDASAPAHFEERIDGFRDEEVTDVVDLHEAVDLVVGELVPWRAARHNAGVVDQNIHAAVTLLDAFDGFGYLRFIRHVTDGRMRDAARGANLIANFGGVLDVQYFYLRAISGQTNRGRASQPRGRARDDRNTIFQTTHYFSSSLRAWERRHPCLPWPHRPRGCALSE